MTNETETETTKKTMTDSERHRKQMAIIGELIDNMPDEQLNLLHGALWCVCWSQETSDELKKSVDEIYERHHPYRDLKPAGAASGRSV